MGLPNFAVTAPCLALANFCLTANFVPRGFTVPEVADPATGVLAARAFFVVFRELISDFFWIVIVLAPLIFLNFSITLLPLA
jgi:hypothetical protein